MVSHLHHGEIYLIIDLINKMKDASQEEIVSVRITGRLGKYNCTMSTARVYDPVDKTNFIDIDTHLIEPFTVNPQSLCQVLGEVKKGEDGVARLQARVIRCCEGLDYTQYKRAVLDQKKLFDANSVIN